MAGKTSGGRVTPPKPVKSTSSLAAPRGAKQVTGMSAPQAKDLTVSSKTGTGSGSFAAPEAPAAPKPPTGGKWKQGAEGGWESGTKSGKWEQGATGQWAAAATGGKATGGKTSGKASGGTAPNGVAPTGFRNQVITSAGARDAGSPHGIYEAGGGAAGGGGSGNPLAALSSAVQSLNLKGTEFGGKSVEEVIGYGAKKTRKTGAKRTS